MGSGVAVGSGVGVAVGKGVAVAVAVGCGVAVGSTEAGGTHATSTLSPITNVAASKFRILIYPV